MKTETRAKAAILNSYTEPVAYKDYILFQGKVIVHWKSTAKTSWKGGVLLKQNSAEAKPIETS